MVMCSSCVFHDNNNVNMNPLASLSSCDQMSQAIHSKRASHPEPLLEATSCHHWLSWWNFHLCRSNWWGCLKNRLPSTIIGLSSGSLAFPVWFPVWNVRLYYFMGYNGILIFFSDKTTFCVVPWTQSLAASYKPMEWSPHLLACSSREHPNKNIWGWVKTYYHIWGNKHP